MDEAASITKQLIAEKSVRNTTINIANVATYPLIDIVSAMENFVGKHAVYNVVERGSEYQIDTSFIFSLLEKAGVKFGNDYLERIIERYYEKICNKPY